MKITFSAYSFAQSGSVAVFLSSSDALGKAAQHYDDLTSGAIKKAVKAGRFDGKKGDLLEIVAPANTDLNRLLLVGTGAANELNRHDFEAFGASLCKKLLCSGEDTLTIVLDDDIAGSDAAAHGAALAAGVLLRSYRFDKYRTKEPQSKKPTLEKVVISTENHEDASNKYEMEEAVISGVFLTRDLVSEPANIIHPESFATLVKGLEQAGLQVDVLGEKEMAKLGMNALLAVGHGSDRESHLAVMRWNGADDNTQPLAFIGKGVTFDTGGISLKPSEGMEQMKWDMGGAGIVVGLMKALAARKAKINAVGVIGLVENMPSGRAQRPGDVVTSMSGQTIEVLNTDAEGRLVLADALWYTQDRFKPSLMIDLATLTGAMIISLGHEYAGYFTDDETIATQLYKAGDESGDKLWRLPLAKAYDKLIDCDIADMKNIGGRAAGSITAAQFLKRFTNDVPWAHIDVAGVVWSDKEGPLYEKGATGFGVRALDRFVAENYEN